MRTGGCVSFPHSRLEQKKKGLEQKRVFLSCARRKGGWAVVLLPLTTPAAGTEAHFLSCTRAVEKIRTSGCASLPHSRLGPGRIFLSCTRALKKTSYVRGCPNAAGASPCCGALLWCGEGSAIFSLCPFSPGHCEMGALSQLRRPSGSRGGLTCHQGGRSRHLGVGWPCDCDFGP